MAPDIAAAEPPAPAAPTLPAGVLKVVRDVAERHGLPPSAIFADFTDREVVDCRSEIFWRLKNRSVSPLTISALARLFRKSRATVQSCVQRHTHLRILAQRGSFS